MKARRSWLADTVPAPASEAATPELIVGRLSYS